jgi:hypothetical protein
MKRLFGDRRSAIVLLTAVLLLLVGTQAVLLAQNLGAAPQTNVAVQGATGRSTAGRRVPESCELDRQRDRASGRRVGNRPPGCVSYISGRGVMRYVITGAWLSGHFRCHTSARILDRPRGGGGVS